MTGSRTGAADLTTRLTKEDIHNLIEMINTGSSVIVAHNAHHISYSSFVRIFQSWNWTPAQKHHWDYDNLPEVIWPEDTKRPKGTYPPGDPMPETKSSKKTVFRQKNTEYESGSTDAKRYQNENGDETPNVVTVPDKVTLEPNDKISVIVEKAIGNDLDLVEPMPELDRSYQSIHRSKIYQRELIHRVESVECCFELMVEEFNKLKDFLSN